MKSSVLSVLLSLAFALSLPAQGIGSGPMSMIDGTGQLGVVGSPGVSSNDQSLIVPIPDCGPCEPGDDPWTEDVIPLPPMPKAPGLPPCYPNCVTEGANSPQVQSLELNAWTARLPLGVRPEARVALTRGRATN